MATNDIGARIKLEGEQQYREQMRQITQQTKLMKTETASMQQSWDKNTSSMQKATQQSELLRSQIKQQNAIVATAEANVDRYSAETGENSSETLKWKNVLAQAKAELQRLETELANVPNKMQLVGQSMQAAGKKIQSVGRGITTVGTTLTRYVTAPIVAIGAASVKTTASFDTSMSKVQALSGATGEDFTKLRNKARKMGATTKYSAGEAADALSYMALAGWDTEQMTEGLDGVLNLAAASGMELADASDLVTDYLSAFGLEAKDASRMADELAYAQAHSNTTTQQLGEAFGNSAAQMNTAGQSMETTTAILEAFANQGLKGSEAGTALSAMMRDITQKMKNGKIYIGETAITVQDANGNFRDMTDILADVEAATDGMGSAEKSAALMTTFTARSVKGVSMALNEGTGNIKAYKTSLQGATGAAADMAATMQDNLAGELTKLKSAAQELGISIGDILVPKIRTAVEWVQKQVDKFNALDDSTKEQIVKYGLLAAAIGPVVTVIGKLVQGVGWVIDKVGFAIEALGTFGSVLAPVTVGIGLAAGAAIALKEGYDYMKESARKANAEMYESVDALTDSAESMKKAGEGIKTAMDDAEASIGAVETTAKRANKAVDVIEKLQKSGKLTSEEMNTMKGAVNELNGLFPELGLSIDESTGALNKSTSEIRTFIAETTKMAKVQAYHKAIAAVSEEIANAYAEQARAAYELEKAKAQITEAEAAQAKQSAAYQRSLEGLTDEQRELVSVGIEVAEANDVNALALRDAKKAANEASDEYDSLGESVDEATDYCEYLTKEEQRLAKELGLTTDELEGTSDAADDAGDAYDDLGDSAEDAADSIEDATEEIIKAYEDSYKSAKDSLMGQSDLWEELEETEKTSVAEMQKNLGDHTKAYRDFNTNARRLMNDSRYGVDQAFTGMVNSIISAGIEAGPRLQAIVDEIDKADGDISGLVEGFGDFDQVSSDYAEIMAETKTAIEYGVEDMKTALEEGAPKVEKASEELIKAAKAKLEENRFNETFKNTGKEVSKSLIKGVEFNPVKNALDKGMTFVFTTLAKQGEKDGATVSESISTGVESGSPQITDAGNVIVKGMTKWIGAVEGLQGSAQTAGNKTPTGTAQGITAGKTLVTTAMNSLKAGMQTNIIGIGNLNGSAKSSGLKVDSGLQSGVTTGNKGVSGAMTIVKNTVVSGINNVSGLSGSAYNSGAKMTSSTASGIGSKRGAVSSQSTSVARAAESPITSMSVLATSWGMHLGANFANGISSRYGSVIAAARRIANAVKSILGHSTPEEGPLKDDDVWGEHFVENFAEGIVTSIPIARNAAFAMAKAVEQSTDMYTMPTSGAEAISQGITSLGSVSGDEITINVYASEGMNVNQLADEVQNRLALLQRQRARVYA